jgi:hypothetical protein
MLSGIDIRVTQACPLEKFPLQACAATSDGLLICPKSLRESKTSSPNKVRKSCTSRLIQTLIVGLSYASGRVIIYSF